MFLKENYLRSLRKSHNICLFDSVVLCVASFILCIYYMHREKNNTFKLFLMGAHIQDKRFASFP